MNRRYFAYFMIPALAIAAGCEKKHAPPPTERGDLVVRFFTSIANGDSAAAAVQGKKIYAMDTHNEFVMRLITVQESNESVRMTQAKINQGDINGALKVLEQGIASYPENRTLQTMYPRVRQLRNAQKLLNSMRRAGSSAAMRAALTAATTGLSSNISPELAEFFRAYEQRIAEVEKKEKLAAQSTAAPPPPPANSARQK